MNPALLKSQDLKDKMILFSGISVKYLSLEDFTLKLDQK